MEQVRRPLYPLEEFGRRGNDIYEGVVKPTLTPEDHGKYLAIDIDTEDFVLDDNDRRAVDALHERRDNAQVFEMRVGYPAVARL